MEIGSNFVFETLDNNNSCSIMKYLNNFGQNTIFFDSGRNALRYVAKLSNKKVVLLPNYLCESIIQPFIEEGYKIMFYEIAKDLTPKINNLKSLLEIGIFLHMGYFGYNTNLNIKSTIDLLKSNGIIIIEDITHTIFSTYVRDIHSDYYICSLRKWIGIPDGGILISKKELEHNPYPINEDLYELIVKANGEKTRFFSSLDKEKTYLELYNQAECLLNEQKNIYSMSPHSMEIITNYDFDSMIFKRRKNYKKLYQGLKNIGILLNSTDFDENIVPLFLPIFLQTKQERDALKNYLVENSIYTPIHWKTPKNIVGSIIDSIYNLELSIPCDQRYSSIDMDKIISKIVLFKETFND